MAQTNKQAISAEQFLKHAKYYLYAADILTSNLSTATVGPIGLLASQSLELGLKAFLLHRGWEEKALRQTVGHNLVNAWDAAAKAGLKLRHNPSLTVQLLSISHSSPYLFRYPQEGKAAAITPPHKLCEDVLMVLDAVENAIALPATLTEP